MNIWENIVASYSGLKKEFLPAYLDPKVRNTVEELMSGVSFASAGSGYDPLTPTIPVRILIYYKCYSIHYKINDKILLFEDVTYNCFFFYHSQVSCL